MVKQVFPKRTTKEWRDQPGFFLGVSQSRDRVGPVVCPRLASSAYPESTRIAPVSWLITWNKSWSLSFSLSGPLHIRTTNTSPTKAGWENRASSLRILLSASGMTFKIPRKAMARLYKPWISGAFLVLPICSDTEWSTWIWLESPLAIRYKSAQLGEVG